MQLNRQGNSMNNAEQILQKLHLFMKKKPEMKAKLNAD